MNRQRTYIVKYTVLKSGDERTVQITTSDGINAARLAYLSFGRKKIRVTSVEVVKNAVQKETSGS